MPTTYIPIPNNKETQRQVNAILVIEKLKKEFEQMSYEEKQKFIELYG